MIPLLLSLAHATDYSVGPTDDLAPLVAGLLPGDSVVFGPGDYLITEPWVWDISGESAAPIVFRGEEGANFIMANSGGFPAAGIVLSGASWLVLEDLNLWAADGWDSEDAWFQGIRLDACSDIVLRGLDISYIAAHLIRIDGESERVTVEDSRLHNTRSGSGVWVGCGDGSCLSEDHVIRRNWIYNLLSSSGHGVVLYHGVQSSKVQDNVIYAVDGWGVWLGSTGNGPANAADANAIWRSNAGIYVVGAATVQNNLVFNIEGWGLISQDPDLGTFEDINISYNTVANTSDWGMYLEDWETTSGNILSNNAVCNPVGRSVYLVDPDSDDEIEPYQNHLISSNLLCGWMLGLYDYADHFVVGEGLADFSSIEAWDYYPAVDSLLVDGADTSSGLPIPIYDFNGMERSADSPEIGAYDWNGESNPGWAVQEGFKDFDLRFEAEELYVGGCCSEQGPSKAFILAPLLALGALLRRKSSARG
jgi:hypothetical protein